MTTLRDNYKESSAESPKTSMPASLDRSFSSSGVGSHLCAPKELRQKIERPELGKNFAAKKIEVAALVIKSNQNRSPFGNLDHLRSETTSFARQPSMSHDMCISSALLQNPLYPNNERHRLDPTESALVSERRRGVRKSVTFSDTPRIHEIENFYQSTTPESGSQIAADDEVFMAGEKQSIEGLEYGEDEEEDEDEESSEEEEVRTPSAVGITDNKVDLPRNPLFAVASIGNASKQTHAVEGKQMFQLHPDNTEQRQQQPQHQVTIAGSNPVSFPPKRERRRKADSILDMLIASPIKTPYSTHTANDLDTDNGDQTPPDQVSLESIEKQIMAAITRARNARFKASHKPKLPSQNGIQLTNATNDTVVTDRVPNPGNAEHLAESDEGDTSTAASLEHVPPHYLITEKGTWENTEQSLPLESNNQTTEFGKSLISELEQITANVANEPNEMHQHKLVFVGDDKASWNKDQLQSPPEDALVWYTVDEKNDVSAMPIESPERSRTGSGLLYLQIVAAENLDFPIDKGKQSQNSYTSHGQQLKRLITTRSNGITRYVNRSNGALAQSRVSLDNIMDQCREKSCTASFALVNGWYRPSKHPLGAKAKREKYHDRIPEKAVGRLTVELFYLPNVDPKTDAGLPKDIYTCEQAMNARKFHQTRWQAGYMSQLGGDFWRRRYFQLQGGRLFSFTDTFHSPRIVIDLSKAVLLACDHSIIADTTMERNMASPVQKVTQDDNHIAGHVKSLGRRPCVKEDEICFSVKNGFQIFFNNGEKIEFFCDSAEDRSRWLEVLTVMLGKVPPRPAWMDKTDGHLHINCEQ
ncbi:Bud site selection protein bud4 [Apophysomyces ossiformis]|uniref:Bud site selection protein bud4 n=1 Tax=Apophysomyces ossiformis TaxID=679940 RepID=A0A8H7BW83_9FUNG|nr:Bud site selection protein bud4 [Apophysomyces ossiformis]